MTFSAWRVVFLTGAGVYAVGAAVYVALIQAHPQPWNYRRRDDRRYSAADLHLSMLGVVSNSELGDMYK